MTKVFTPYQRLLTAVRKYYTETRYPEIHNLCLIPRDKIDQHWSMRDIATRAQVADTLGWDVVVKSTEKGLVFNYVRRPADIDYYVG